MKQNLTLWGEIWKQRILKEHSKNCAYLLLLLWSMKTPVNAFLGMWLLQSSSIETILLFSSSSSSSNKPLKLSLKILSKSLSSSSTSGKSVNWSRFCNSWQVRRSNGGPWEKGRTQMTILTSDYALNLILKRKMINFDMDSPQFLYSILQDCSLKGLKRDPAQFHSCYP